MDKNGMQFIAKEIHIGKQDFSQAKNIMLCGDHNYIKYIGVTLTSIVMNNPKADYAFHIFCDDIDDIDLKRLHLTNELYGCSINICFFDIATINKLAKTVNNESHVNVGALFRIIGFNLLPDDVSTVLYLDSDVLVSGAIDEFWNKNMNTDVAMVIEDRGHCRHEKTIGVKRYFNSGVMFVDVIMWKTLDLTEKCLELLFNGNKWRFVDQDVLNVVLADKALFIKEKYNYQYRLNYTENNINLAGETPVIWHFIGISKPWCAWTQEFDVVKQYNTIVKKSCWNDIKLTVVDDINNLWVKYKIYQVLCRGDKKHKRHLSYMVNFMWYGFYKIKYMMS